MHITLLALSTGGGTTTEESAARDKLKLAKNYPLGVGVLEARWPVLLTSVLSACARYLVPGGSPEIFMELKEIFINLPMNTELHAVSENKPKHDCPG